MWFWKKTIEVCLFEEARKHRVKIALHQNTVEWKKATIVFLAVSSDCFITFKNSARL